MRERVDYGGTDTEAGKGAGTRHEMYLGDIVPVLVVFLQFVVNET